VAPGDRAAQGLLARGQIPHSTGQEGEPPLESDEQRLRRQDLRPGRCQLDREGQSVKPPADLGDGRGGLVGDGEVRVDAPGPFDKQAHRLVLAHAIGRREMARIRSRERGDREFVLHRDVQGDPTGDEHGQIGAFLDERGDVDRRRNDLLEIVEDEENVLAAQRGRQTLEGRSVRCFTETECIGDGPKNPRRIANRRQRYEVDAIRKPADQVRGDLERQARLADPRWPGHRDQAYRRIEELRTRLRPLVLPTDKGRRWDREPGRRGTDRSLRGPSRWGGRRWEQTGNHTKASEGAQSCREPGLVCKVRNFHPLPTGQRVFECTGQRRRLELERKDLALVLPGELDLLLDIARLHRCRRAERNQGLTALDPFDDLGTPRRAAGDAPSIDPDGDAFGLEQVGNQERSLAVRTRTSLLVRRDDYLPAFPQPRVLHRGRGVGQGEDVGDDRVQIERWQPAKGAVEREAAGQAAFDR
jgi:hypothetical protein